MKACDDASAPKAEIGWTPRYVQYARRYGRTPGEQYVHDAHAWPGGTMAGFICFMNGRWQEFRAAHGLDRDADVSDEEHAKFDAWLVSRVDDILVGGRGLEAEHVAQPWRGRSR